MAVSLEPAKGQMDTFRSDLIYMLVLALLCIWMVTARISDQVFQIYIDLYGMTTSPVGAFIVQW